MSFKYRTNITPENFNYAMWQSIMTLMDAGWNTLAWSDGTTVNLTGTEVGPYSSPPITDPVFSAAETFQLAGASIENGLGNNRAWILLRQPKGSGEYGSYGGKRMIVIQRGNSNAQWRIKYSKEGMFVKESATNVNTPFGPVGTTDEVYICGGGTDEFPTFSTIFRGVDGGQRMNCIANDGLSSESAPFGFLMVSWAAGGGGRGTHAWMFDPMINGTTNPQDVDPYVHYIDFSNSLAFSADTDSSINEISGGAVKCWFRYGMLNPGQEFSNAVAMTYNYRNSINGISGIGIPGADATFPIGSNSHNNFDDFFPIPYCRQASLGGNAGYKGVSSMLRWISTARSIGDTFTLSATRDRLCLVTCVTYWDGTVPLV